MSNDENTTVAALRREMQRFVEERDWQQFHSPKNLSMAIAIEAAELMEHYQWLNEREAAQAAESAETMAKVREELADVLCFALSFANALGIDISQSVRAKMIKNATKYPVERFRGRFR
mgnify:CR=1 FL=1